MFLPFLPSGVRRSGSDLPKPLRSRGSLLLREELPPAPVIASQPLDFNIPDLGGLVCPTSIRTASTSSLPDMQSRIQAGSGQARNPTATLGFSKPFVQGVMEGMMALSEDGRGPADLGFAIAFPFIVTP